VAYLVKSLGLRPLAVHFDNGWNSELAVKNIEQTLRKLDIELYTDVVDWEEFRDFQLALIRSGVPNIEAVTDHSINALLFRVAGKVGVRYFVGGGNLATEGVMPRAWMYDSRDWRFLAAVHRRFGTLPLKTLVHCNLWDYFYYVILRRIKYVPILNYVDYVKADAKLMLKREIGWRDYGGKHFESIFTRFFQGYILPSKFGIDKRRPHLSSLILSKQITREQALVELDRPLYDATQLKEDRVFFLKKLGMTEEEFSRWLEQPAKSYFDYPTHAWLLYRMPRFIRWVKAIVRPKSLR
jgi:hypothetical protein